MTQPTHLEVIAFCDESEKTFSHWYAEAELNGDKRFMKIWETAIAHTRANRAGLERHKERPFNWTTDQAVGMFSEAFPEPPQLPRCVTCRYENFPCPSYTDIADPIRSVMG